MGAAHSKRRSSRDTYHRMFSGILCRAPSGRRWTKPSVIVEALSVLAMKEGAIGVAPLLAYAQKCEGMIRVKPAKRGEPFKRTFPKGDKGNVFLEYAWSLFNRDGKHKRVMSEQDIMAAHTAGKVSVWYEALTPRASAPKVDRFTEVKNKKGVKRTFTKARHKAQSEAERMKRIGDERRAETARFDAKRNEFASEFRVEETLLQSFKDMLR